MSYLMMILMATCMLFALFVWIKIKAAERELERLFKTNQALESKVKQQAVEIQQKNAEVKNAKVAQQARNRVNHSSAYTIDEQLHAHGYFRDGNDHGVRGVQPNLSKSCGHNRDETADSCPQSDSSGDLST